MKAKHTPGPWLFRDKNEAVYTSSKTHPYGSLIFRFDEDEGPSDADLNLILAAPVLFEALQDLLNDVGRDNSMLGAVKARAAIAKVLN